MYRGWTQTDHQNKHYNINQKWLQRVHRMDTDYQNKHYNINQKWLQHVQRMDTNRPPKPALQYKSKVPTSCTEDGHKQTTKTSTTIYTKSGYNMYRGWTQTDYQNKDYNINQKDEGT